MAAEIDESRYEMRLALVLNGGVSLAVWMGGVTAEIDHMRRAAYPALTQGDNDPVLERWERLLDRFGVRLVVDVIAGASAGGLNGAVLAAAIARAHPLPPLRDVWLEVGSIANLASAQDQQPGADRLSILDGNLLTASIAKVFADMTPLPGGATRPSSLRDGLEQEATLPRSVTLFTTATSMRGQGEEFTDSTNQRFTQVEYRVLCRFRRSLMGDDEFKDDKETNWRLTRAARASASFPAAFEPTFFRAGERAVGEPPAATQVAMGATAGITGSRWMIDGGVLDNEPFAPVLDRIARRPIIREVDRIVAYIDPEDATAPTGNDDVTKPPGMIETVVAAMNLPRETNLLNQLGRLEQMKREVEVDSAGDLRLLKRALAGKLDQAARELEPIYRERTKAAIAHEIRLAVQSGRSTDDPSVPVDDLPLPDASKAHDGRWDKSVSAAERMLRIALRLTRSAAGNGPNNPEIAAALLAISVALMQLSRLRVVVFAEAVNALEAGSAPFELSDEEIYRTWSDALTPERRALIAAIVADGLRPFVAARVWPPKVAPPGAPDAQRAGVRSRLREDRGRSAGRRPDRRVPPGARVSLLPVRRERRHAVLAGGRADRGQAHGAPVGALRWFPAAGVAQVRLDVGPSRRCDPPGDDAARAAARRAGAPRRGASGGSARVGRRRLRRRARRRAHRVSRGTATSRDARGRDHRPDARARASAAPGDLLLGVRPRPVSLRDR